MAADVSMVPFTNRTSAMAPEQTTRPVPKSDSYHPLMWDRSHEIRGAVPTKPDSPTDNIEGPSPKRPTLISSVCAPDLSFHGPELPQVLGGRTYAP